MNRARIVVACSRARLARGLAVSEPQSWADLALYLNNLPPATGAHTGDGKHLSLGAASYGQFCRSCHGEDGRGDDDGFVPSLRNQHYRYLLKEMRKLAAGHRFKVDEDLARIFRNLKADEMEGLADYLSRMQGPVRDMQACNEQGLGRFWCSRLTAANSARRWP
jgi:cytochrome c553